MEKKKRREPAARVFSIIIRQSICVRMDCALRGGREGLGGGGEKGGTNGGLNESGRERVAGRSRGEGGRGRGSRRDCGVAGVVSESRVQPSGSYEYII